MLIILGYIRGWRSLPTFNLSENFEPKTPISLLIPARNEADNIAICLHAIAAQNYPKHLLEVIVIDDHSTDGTDEGVKKLNFDFVKVIYLKDHLQGRATNAYKKAGIAYGISQSKNELIVTTDADCESGKDWLRYLAACYETTGAKFIAAPVQFHLETSLIEQFQSLDFAGMMGVTGAGIHTRLMRMCNGANLAYQRAAYDAINGFEGINQKASGDDMLLMQKVVKVFPDGIQYLKNTAATVLTKAQPTLNDFLRQRIRWASKSGDYQEVQVTLILALVFFFCCNILLSLLLALVYGGGLIWVFVFQLLVKTILDFFFLRMMAHFFERKDLMGVFMPAQLMHIAYIIVVGFAANLKRKYVWKGREVR